MSSTDACTTDFAAPAAGFADGTPHGWIESLTCRLERIILGRAAAAWLAGEFGPLPRNAAVVSLPAWRWATSRISVGRKDVSRDGGRLLMPVRVTWSPQAVLVIPTGTTVEVQWRASGMGHTGSGATTLAASRHIDYLADLDTTVESDEAGMPTRITADPLPGPKLKAHLRKLADDGVAAQWEAIASIEGFVTKAVAKANTAIATRISATPESARLVLDGTEVDQVANEMLYGTEESDAKGRKSDVFRLLDRCTQPGTFNRVEPERYIRNALWSAADAAVRRKIGDPFIGDKIRAVQASGNYATTDELVAAYRELYPRDRLSHGRAEAALSLAPKPTTFSYSATDRYQTAGAVFDGDDYCTDFSDALVDAIDARRARMASALDPARRAELTAVTPAASTVEMQKVAS